MSAESDIEIHELIRGRWSSRNYDPDRPIPAEMVDRLLEAARWAPSSRNAQPWRYIVFDRRDERALEKARACLNPGNRNWAGRAPLLLLSVAETVGAGGQINSKAYHDLGLANENLMLQAIAMGLHCRPMGGFDHDCARMDFGIPPGFEPAVMIAVGYPGNAADLPEELRNRESASRNRRKVEAFAYLSAWDSEYPGRY
jgi:nitroreductase